MTTFLSIAAGTVLLAVLLSDVFGTVFVPRGGPGHLTERVYRSAWWLWRRLARAAPPRLRRRVLALGGPLLLPLTVALWAGELVAAFSLVYLPLVDTLALSQPAEGPATWVTALYYSGYSATTLGVGDVMATTTPLRLLGVLEAALGFSLFSVAVTYLLSVYGALTRTTSLARGIARFVRRADGGDAVDLLVRVHDTGTQDQLTRWLSQTSFDLQRVIQGQAQYPLLHYFHMLDDESALPLTLPDLLETVTLARAVLDPAASPAVARGPSRWRSTTPRRRTSGNGSRRSASGSRRPRSSPGTGRTPTRTRAGGSSPRACPCARTRRRGRATSTSGPAGTWPTPASAATSATPRAPRYRPSGSRTYPRLVTNPARVVTILRGRQPATAEAAMAVAEDRQARRTVASYDTYPQAQEAVDVLSDRRFPVQHLAIVGRDLRFVEQVTGRQGYAGAALQGLLSGALTGAFVGLLLGLLNLFDPLASALILAFYGLLAGAVIGLIIGLIAHAFQGGRRDFSSVSAMRADRYEVLADEEVADEATRMLAQHHAGR